ncbi:MAG: hypothetical protein E7176_06800 [Erysipelotrichaceae bacterium]|nr:hypothetical protein [Erysipelotrichaceae bacterium]
MKNYKLHISEGYNDTYGLEMLVKKEIENRSIKEFQSHGYELIKTPTLEYIDVYSSECMQKPDLYSLINRQGEVLALCNDMTSSIARYVCSNNLEGPLKYCYTADVFRYPKLYQGKKHQFLQAGIELIGAAGKNADVECLYLAHKLLKACNVKEFTIHIGSATFLDALLDDFNINTELKTKIYSVIENKDYVTLNNVLHENLDKKKADFIIDLMLVGGKQKYIDNLINELKDTKASKELEYLKSIYQALKDLNVENIIFDFSIYSYANYYTGIIFAVYIEGISKAVIEGGRCDNLFSSFGKDMNNIGFGFDIDALTTYALNNDLINFKQERYLSFIADDSIIYACKNNDVLRANGVIVNNLDFGCVNCAIKYAKANGYDKVLEYKDNTVKLWEVAKC